MLEMKLNQAERLVKELKKLNPSVEFEVKAICGLDSAFIYGSIPGRNLILPRNVFYNEKWGFNNGKSQGSMEYQHIPYEYVH